MNSKSQARLSLAAVSHALLFLGFNAFGQAGSQPQDPPATPAPVAAAPPTLVPPASSAPAPATPPTGGTTSEPAAIEPIEPSQQADIAESVNTSSASTGSDVTPGPGSPPVGEGAAEGEFETEAAATPAPTNTPPSSESKPASTPPAATAPKQQPSALGQEPSPDRQKTNGAVNGNLGAQFDLRPYSRPVVKGFGYGGFIQGQYLDSQLSEDQLQQGGTPLNRDEFTLRSARLRVEQGYEYTAYGLELDATTTRTPYLSIRRAEATLLYRGDNPADVAPLIALSAGVIDLPFGFEVAESVRTRLFMERSVASSALFPTQNDVGLRLFGAWRFARYAFALVNGEPFGGNTWPSDPNSAKDVLGRLGGEGSLTTSIAVAGGASFAFGKGFHPGRAAVKDSLFWRDDNQDGIATSTEIVGVPGTSASESSNFERFALGIDLELQVATALGSSRAYGEAYVASNHDRGLFVSDPVVTGVDLRQWGGYVALSQDITEYAVVALRADLYNPNADLFDQRRGEFVPATQRIVTFSPAVGLVLPRRARLLAQYDFIDDYFARTTLGVPKDAKNNQWTVRLQVEL